MNLTGGSRLWLGLSCHSGSKSSTDLTEPSPTRMDPPSHDSPVGRTDMVQTALWLMQDSDNGFPFQTVRTVPTSALYAFPSMDWWIGVAYEKVSQE